ncbi:hypothetical protein [Amycolatopsis nalaikhensis]|uniref:AAA+ ATPase domain-containing protein n=1 Tax=Amycolatopsis nalaikhensis TaxID=715472 RepID=A0ABY8XGS4_9PSEU|nr:hypothetical protein [Amycolatopsis sp. 2-2]WIV54830.1 hypothetical protein QP939_39290 [Amycolatopsis sp. 2-2]
MNAEVTVGGAGAVILVVAAAVVLLRLRRTRLTRGSGTLREPVTRLTRVPREPLSAVFRGGLRARIEETFASGRFCVLLGGPGTGKTHLAAAYARDCRAPVVWVTADPARAFAELAEAGADAGLAWVDSLDDALVVFDDATDPDALTRWLPARARVLVTTTVPDFEILGGTVPVGGFTEPEAVGFLCARSGHDADEAALDVVRELGCLPLALAQAGGVLRQQGLSFASYLDRVPHTPPLEREPGEAHPACVEDTTLAALATAAAQDSRAQGVAEVLALLAAGGVRRELAHRIGPDPVAVDAALHGLAEASLAEFDVPGELVSTHRLTRRAILGRLHGEERLAPALDRAFDVLEGPTADLADHTAALWRHFRALPSAELGPRLGRMLRLRRRSVDELVASGAAAQARALGREVLADHEAYLPPDHEDTTLAAESLRRAGAQRVEPVPSRHGRRARR